MSTPSTVTIQGSPLPSRRARRLAESTPSSLMQLAQVVGENASYVGRHTVVVAAASGLAFTTTAMSADPSQAAEAASKVNTADDNHAVPTVNAPEGVDLSFETPTASVKVEAPEKPKAANSGVQSLLDAAGSEGASKVAAEAEAYVKRVLANPAASDGRESDCFKFVRVTFEKAGVPYKNFQVAMGSANPKRGDVLFYKNNGWDGNQHYSIYLGGGRAANGNWNHGGVGFSGLKIGFGVGATPTNVFPQ